jgi:single-stranded DNA-binding protein
MGSVRSGGLGQTWRNAVAFKKGAQIRVEGELRSREYESNGVKVRTYDIVATSIINLRAGQRNQAEPLSTTLGGVFDPFEAAA